MNAPQDSTAPVAVGDERVGVLAAIKHEADRYNPGSALAKHLNATHDAVAELIAHVESEYADLADITNEWPGRCSVAGQERLCRIRDLIAKARGRDAREVQDEFTMKRSIERAACGATK
jgi:hypothetical protein